MVIQTNTLALNIARQLKNTGSLTNSSSMRLSTGKRINSAADDASGLAIAQKFKAQINGLEKAVRNVTDGISLFETADGALNEVSSMLVRIRELSVQAINDTNTDEDRAAINDEIIQLLDEIESISAKTEFNKFKPLKSDGSKVSFRTFTNTVTTTNSFQALMSNYSLNNNSVQNVLKTGYDLHNSNQSFRVTQPGNSPVTITFSVDDEVTKASTSSIPGGFENLTQNLLYKPDGTVDDAMAQIFLDTVLTALQEGFKAAGVSSPLIGGYTDKKEMYFAFTDGTLLGIGGCTGNLTHSFGHEFMHLMFSSRTANISTSTSTTTSSTQKVVEVIPKEVYIQTGANAAQGKTFSWLPIDIDAYGYRNISVLTKLDAERTLIKTDSMMQKILNIRSAMGSYINRLEHAAKNLGVSLENMLSSHSRIEDADMAKEMMNKFKASIRVEAGTTMLAQANQMSSNVLQLLRL